MTLNVRLLEHVEQPSSVIMDVVTYPHKWEFEWYTTWYTRKHNPNKEGEKRKSVKARKHSKKKKKKKSSRSRRSAYHDDEDEEDEEEDEEIIKTPEVPEIGQIYTIRFRGEKASLVHLDHFVSYLSQSRWKKKYFPNKGIFSLD